MVKEDNRSKKRREGGREGKKRGESEAPLAAVVSSTARLLTMMSQKHVSSL